MRPRQSAATPALRRRAPATRRRASRPESTAGIARASRRVPAADHQIDFAAGASARTSRIAGSTITRSPIRSSRSSRMRRGIRGRAGTRRRRGPPTPRGRRPPRGRAGARAGSRIWSVTTSRLFYRDPVDHDAEVAVVRRAEHDRGIQTLVAILSWTGVAGGAEALRKRRRYREGVGLEPVCRPASCRELRSRARP